MGASTDSSSPNSTIPSPDQRNPNNNNSYYYGSNAFTQATYMPSPYSPEAVGVSVDAPEVPLSADEEAFKNKISILKQRLINAFVIINLAAVLLWVLVGAGFPWFMYISFAAAFIECIIYGAKAKEPLFITYSIYININVILFLTYLATGGGFPWFIYPLISLTAIPVIHNLVKNYRKSPYFWLYLHTYFYTMANAICFFTWMINSLYEPYPWFIFPVCGWGVLLIVHYNFSVMKDKSRMIFYILVDLGIMLTIALRFAMGAVGTILICCALFCVVVCSILRKKGLLCYKHSASISAQQSLAQQPSEPIIPQYFAFIPGYQQMQDTLQQHPFFNQQQQPQQQTPLTSQQPYQQPPQMYQPQPQYIVQPAPYQQVSMSSLYPNLPPLPPGYQLIAINPADKAVDSEEQPLAQNILQQHSEHNTQTARHHDPQQA